MIYVDDLFTWPPTSKRWCHMMADTDAELDAFAEKLGLKTAWKHGDHYDLSPPKRSLAVRWGAVEITRVQMVGIRQGRR